MITAFPVFSSSPMIEATVMALEISDRKVDVWFWPAEGKSKGVILFSHGAFSAPRKYEELIHYWVKAGYDVHAPLRVILH